MKRNHPYIQECPNGCHSIFIESDIVMPEGTLKRCTVCGQLVSQCTEESYNRSRKEWSDELGTWPSDKDIKRRVHRRTRTISKINKILSRNYDFSLLDVGCSSGFFIWLAKQFGIDAEGAEPEEQPALSAKGKGLAVHHGLLRGLHLPESRYDAVTMFEVIEHIKDPVPLLNECYRLLKPGGLLVIETGNTDSWTSAFMKSRWDFYNIHVHGEHISFYSTESIRSLARNTHFEIVSIKTSSVKFYDRGDVNIAAYRLAKICSELLNLPSKAFGKGHQMEAYLKPLKKV